MSNSLFSNLKEDLEAAKEEMTTSEIKIEISKMLVITDGWDNVDWRFEVAERIAKRHNAELSKLYLYDLKGSLFHPEDKGEVTAINSLRAHSEKIKELKEKGVGILFDETVKNFLIGSREIRQTTEEDERKITPEDVDTITEFFLDDADMEFNLIQGINDYLDKYQPDIVYWKPNLLEERKWQQELGLSDVDNMILQHIADNSIVVLEGMKKVTASENIVCFIEGGESEIQYQDILTGVQSYFHHRRGTVTFVTIIDENALKIASLTPEEGIEAKDVREIIKSKISQDLNKLRIFDKLPEQRIVFGEIEKELEIILRKLDAELLVVKPRRIGEDKFDGSALGVIEIAIKEGVGVLVLV